MKTLERCNKKKEKSQAELLAEAMHQQTMDVVNGYVGHADMVNHPEHYANSCPAIVGTALPTPAQPARRDLYHICLQPGHFRKDCPTQ